MIRNPEVQEKARRELDIVIGRHRLPTLDDRPNLPYLDRVFYETARQVKDSHNSTKAKTSSVKMLC